MTTIQVTPNVHVTSDDIDAATDAVINGTIGTANGEYPDDVAVAVAAQWQSPGPVGHVLAAFASGRPVERVALSADIVATGRGTFPMWPRDLECLATWLINHD